MQRAICEQMWLLQLVAFEYPSQTTNYEFANLDGGDKNTKQSRTAVWCYQWVLKMDFV